MTILQTLGKILIAPAILVSSWFGHSAPVQMPVTKAPVFGDTFSPAGGLTYRLQGSVGTTNTALTLSSFKNRTQIPLTMALLNTSIGYATLDPQNPTKSEFISFTGITQNSDGTAQITGITRGLADIYPFTASSTMRQTHSGQSIFILSDAPGLFNEYAVKRNQETIPGEWTFPINPHGVTATSSTQLVTLGQVNNIATQGAATSTETKGGIVRLGTIAEQASSYNGGVADPAVLQTKNSTSTCQVVGSYNIVASTTSGKLDKNCFDQTASYTLTGNNTFTGTSTMAISTMASTTVSTSFNANNATVNLPSLITGGGKSSLVASSTVNNTVSGGGLNDTVLATTSVPANIFTTGRVLRIHMPITAYTEQGGGSAENYNWKVFFNGIPVATSTIARNSSGISGVGSLDVTIYAKTTATQEISMDLGIATSTYTRIMSVDNAATTNFATPVSVAIVFKSNSSNGLNFTVPDSFFELLAP